MAPASSSRAAADADTLKTRGNEKYKADQFEEAIKLYKAAAALRPDVPVRSDIFICSWHKLTRISSHQVYLSNLSAAQVRVGFRTPSSALSRSEWPVARRREIRGSISDLRQSPGTLLARRQSNILIGQDSSSSGQASAIPSSR